MFFYDRLFIANDFPFDCDLIKYWLIIHIYIVSITQQLEALININCDTYDYE